MSQAFVSRFLVVWILSATIALAQTTSSQTKNELVVLDAASGIKYWVDSDQYTVHATASDGKELWSHDYLRKGRPGHLYPEDRIAFFEAAGSVGWTPKMREIYGSASDFIRVTFDDMEFGIIRKRNGEYIAMGRD